MNVDSIDALTQSSQTALEKRAFTLRDGSKYRNRSQEFLIRSGDLISSNFFGVNFEYKLRIKSPNSTKKKVRKHAITFAQQQVLSDELLDINQFSLFDIYGAKIVILSISDNFFSKHLSIDGFLEKRKKSKKLLEAAALQAKKAPSDDKLEILRLNHLIYNEIDTMCQRYVADAICEFIINSNELKKEFGIFNMPKRFRNYNNPNEYIAKHITLGSTMLPGWYIELQFKCLEDYEVARTGEAAHLNRDGKSISIPNSLSDIDMNDIPSYMVYTPEGLYLPSPIECAYHHIQPAFLQKKIASENPEKLNKLFENFPEDSNGTFKKI